MKRILMHGCNGRMGLVITELAKTQDDVEIVAGVDITGEKKSDFPVFDSIEKCDVDFDVIIDFSTAKAVDNLIDYALSKGKALVLCTTGLSDEQLKKVEEASKKIAILRSGNMSLGINTVIKLLKEATKTLANAGFDMEIVEKHHNKKLDAPSGTALMLAEAMNSVMNNEYHFVFDRSQVRQQRDAKEIGVSAVRGGSIVGIHEVTYAGPDEVIEIKHTAYSRNIFGNGALAAAKFLADKEAGLYGMDAVV